MSFMGLILGIFVGCSISLFIVGRKVSKSNDIGNTKGDFVDFSKSYLHIIIKQNRIKRPKF